MRRFTLIAAVFCCIASAANAQMLQAIMGGKTTLPAHSLSFSTIASGCSPSSTCAITGTYTGTAPSGSGWTGAWNSACSGSSTISITGSPSAGAWAGTATTPVAACTGTLTVTDNLSDSATSASVTIGYIGPGDIVSFDAWWGLRAYTAAEAATGTHKVVTLRRTSDNVECDILVATTGDIGLTSSTCNGSTQGGITPTAFAGTDASGTGAIVGTALTLTGGHANDTITCGTCQPGTFITGGSSPNWTVFPSQTVASTTITATYGLFVKTLYDHVGSKDFSQTNTALQFHYMPNGDPSSSRISLSIDHYSSTIMTTPATFATTSEPYFVSTVANRASNTVISASVLGTLNNNAGVGGVIGYSSSANFANAFAGTSITKAAPDDSWSSVQTLFNTTTSLCVNNSCGTGNAGTNQSSTQGFLGGDGFGDYFHGYFREGGIKLSTVSAGNQTSLYTNEHVYWGY